MSMCLRAIGALLLTLALPTGTAGAASSDVYEINFQSPYAGPHVINLKEYQPWVEAMEKESGGRLKIHFFMSGAIVKTPETIPALMNGNIDMGAVSPSYQDTMFPYGVATQLPYITRDSRHACALYWKMYETFPEIKKEFDAVGKMLTIWGSDRSGLFSTKGPIKSPADLKGKRVLIWNGGMVDQIKAWGGIPVQVTSNDTYMGLQRGMGDVFLGPLPTGVAYKLMEVAKDITIIPSSTVVAALWINQEVWDDLPPDLQKLIEDSAGGAAAATRYGELLYNATNKDLETMKDAGCRIYTLSDAEIQTFKDADGAVNMAYWEKELARLGVPDPKGWIKTVYDLSASIQ